MGDGCPAAACTHGHASASEPLPGMLHAAACGELYQVVSWSDRAVQLGSPSPLPDRATVRKDQGRRVQQARPVSTAPASHLQAAFCSLALAAETPRRFRARLGGTAAAAVLPVVVADPLPLQRQCSAAPVVLALRRGLAAVPSVVCPYHPSLLGLCSTSRAIERFGAQRWICPFAASASSSIPATAAGASVASGVR